MAYIGQSPFQEFSSVPTKDSFTGDGSTTTFDLANDVVRGAENALEVFVDNVRQEPGTGKAFTLGVDGSNNFRRITFTAAPANGASIYVINDKTNLTAIAPVNTDFNGAELVLDADADTTLHADTDDEIDVQVAGNDIITIKQSSGDGIITIPVDAKDLQFTQFDGHKVLEINDAGFVGVGGNSNAAGEIRIFEDTDNGSNYVGLSAPNVTTSRTYIFPAADGSSGTHLTTDGSGNLSWSASLQLANDSNNRVVTGTGSGLNGEANLTFDGSTLALTGAMTASGAITGSSTLQGTTITATTSFVVADGGNIGSASDTDALAISSGGVVTFTQKPVINSGVAIDDITIDGTEIDLSSGDLTIDVAGDIILDADGGDFKFQDGGTEILRVTNSSSDVVIRPVVDAKDLIFQQRDGTEVARIEDNGTFNVVDDKLAINGTAVTVTAAELNHLNGASSAIQTQINTKTSTGKAIGLALIFGG